MYLKLHTCVLFFIFSSKCFGADEPSEENMGNKISMTVPQLSEEESKSNHMPSHLKCDACLAIVHQLHTAIFKEQKKLTKESKRRALKEYEILEIIEDTCNNGFENYGVKQIDGVNRLSGPGLDAKEVMAMTQMGGRWPHRLQEMCHIYVGEIGEFDMYEMCIKGLDKFTEFMCYGKGTNGHCSHLKSNPKSEL